MLPAELCARSEAQAHAVVWKSRMSVFLSGRHLHPSCPQSFFARWGAAVRGERGVAQKAKVCHAYGCRSFQGPIGNHFWFSNKFGDVDSGSSPSVRHTRGLPRCEGPPRSGSITLGRGAPRHSNASFVNGSGKCWQQSCGFLRRSRPLLASARRDSVVFDVRPRFPSRCASRSKAVGAEGPRQHRNGSPNPCDFQGRQGLGACFGSPWFAGLLGGVTATAAVVLVVALREQKRLKAEKAKAEAEAASGKPFWSWLFPWPFSAKAGVDSPPAPSVPSSLFPNFGLADLLVDFPALYLGGEAASVPRLRTFGAVPFFERFSESAEADVQDWAFEWQRGLNWLLPLQALTPQTHDAWWSQRAASSGPSGVSASRTVLGGMTGVFILWKVAALASSSGRHVLLDWLMKHFTCSVEALRAGRFYTLLTSSELAFVMALASDAGCRISAAEGGG